MTNLFDKTANNYSEFLGSSRDPSPITPGDNDLVHFVTTNTYVARALLCSAACTATIVSVAGHTVTGLPLQQGWNPQGAKRVISVSTGSIWGEPC